jgi:outer membrane PBP1 activator LpoA protein
VLLPENGDYASAAQAVRDGIEAAHQAMGNDRQVKLHFYNSSDVRHVPDLLRSAVADGAVMIIGPLQRKAVERLASEPSLPVATLALNRTASGQIPPPELYQFSLAPEDEAVDVARHAQAKGYRSALMIYPDTTWGLRIATAFREAWGGGGGVLEAGHRYPHDAHDLSEPLDKLFQVGQHGSSGPFGGTMADFVFLVGTAQQVREIWPQIQQRVHHRLPVFATSHVTDGHSDRFWVQELSGLYFVDIPWMIAPLHGEELPLKRFRTSSRRFGNDYQRLFAMGVDAYRLMPRLRKSPMHTDYLLKGRTGNLRIDPERRIHRELVLGRIGSAKSR